jgi:Domain of unknown function (DUF4145)
MAVNRNHWHPPFSKFPSWKCPTCQSGSLVVDQETLKVVETGPSRRCHTNDEWHPDWTEERFAGLLTCQNGECGEIVAIGGRTDCDWGPEGLYRSFNPNFMHPAPPIFPVPDKCPDAVATQLRKAFSLFWSDTGSSANRLRAAAEALLTDRRVPSTAIKNGKRKRIWLHDRIERFKQKEAESADYLLAIKWIGNVGSHYNFDELELADLLDGFELIEHVVERIYVRRDKRLKKMANAINLRKGRPLRPKGGFGWA